MSKKPSETTESPFDAFMRTQQAAKAVGYFAVVVPNSNFYQGFFLMPESLAEGRIMADRARAAFPDDLRQNNPLDGASGPITFKNEDGVAEEDQAILGAMCAALTEVVVLARTGDRRANEEIGTAAGALAALTGNNYFVVVSTPVQGGTINTFVKIPMPVIVLGEMLADKTPDQVATAFIDQMPEVRKIKRHHGIRNRKMN